MVLIWNHNGDQRLLIFVDRVVEAVGDALLDLLYREADALAVVVHGAGAGFEGVELRFRVLRGGRLVCAPVVQHHRDMDDVAAGEAALAEERLIERVQCRGENRLRTLLRLSIGLRSRCLAIDVRRSSGRCRYIRSHSGCMIGAARL